MKVTKENIKSIKYIMGYNDIDIAHNILDSLLIDIAEINQMLEDNNQSYKKIYIDYENEHTEWNPERTDPCPDYYGLFTLRFEKNNYETVSDIIDLNELDSIICALSNFIAFKA